MTLGSKYTTSFDNPLSGRKAEGTFAFNISGNTFTGIATAAGLNEMTIKDGIINGNEISFVMEATSPPGKSNIKAMLDGDKMFGTIELGGQPPRTFEGKRAD